MIDLDGRLLALIAERAGDPALLEATVKAARAQSPQVAELPEEETRRHARALIHGVIDGLAGADGRPSAVAFAAAESFGSDRARQGISVAAFLDGFQAGRAHLLRTLIDEGRQRLDLPPDRLFAELYEVIKAIEDITNALVHRMVHAHRETELEMARTTRDGHMQALRQLLHGEPAEVPGPLDPALAYHCVVSDISDPALARRLEAALIGPGRGLSGLVDGRLAALTTRLPEELPPGTPLLVASPPLRLAGLPARYGLCRRALDAAAAAGLTGLRHLADLALVTATATEPELGGLLSAGLLGALDPGDAFHRELAETALAYLDHAGRVEPAATALHVHPNTVKYRIRRLQELTGRALTEGPGSAVVGAAHWWWALHSWLRHDEVTT